MGTLTRRQFGQAVGAIAGLAVLPATVVQAVEHQPKSVLFEIWDNAYGGLHWDEQTWMAIWADTPGQALDMYWERYDGAVYGDRDDIEVVKFHVFDGPRVNAVCHDAEVLREIGWREECDNQCTECELWEMGISTVCPDCEVCNECGCKCEELETLTPV